MVKIMKVIICFYLFVTTVLIGHSQCGTDSVQDYDGNWYHTVPIGNQCWMKENMRVTHYEDGTEISHVTGDTEWDNLTETDKAWCYYNNSDSLGNIYGALYTWAAAMNGAASSNDNPSGVQGLCPDGWNLTRDYVLMAGTCPVMMSGNNWQNILVIIMVVIQNTMTPGLR